MGHLVRTCPEKGENVERVEEIRPQASVEASIETGLPITQPSVHNDAERELTVETVVDRRLSEVMKAIPSTSHETVENLVVLAEGEVQVSSVEDGIKFSDVVPDASCTEMEHS
ncbi:hypothetical protein QQF64_033762 [Cirrhinus molitorella]|uniref:Uncharacterized protein n=1 Tax=Cirrhinus molitorella TaxID=172907 RepID=A0ABR3MUS9_9TELE